MKANIWYRAANDDAISILIEPVIKRGLHSVRIQRMTADQKEIKGISRFHVDNESEAFDFLSELAADNTSYIGSNPKILEHWKANGLEELLK